MRRRLSIWYRHSTRTGGEELRQLSVSVFTLILTLGSWPASGAQIIRSTDASKATASRTSQFVCTLSAFFSVDSEEIIKGRVTTDGRGLAICRNDQGFTTELPVLADFEATLPESLLRNQVELGISLNTSPFVISRDVNQLQDSYTVRRPPVLGSGDDADDTTVLVRGSKHDLFIELKLTSPTARVSGVKLTGLRLRVDETAPDLF